MLNTAIWNLENSYVKNGTLYAIDKDKFKHISEGDLLVRVDILDLSKINKIDNFAFYQCNIFFDKVIIGKDTHIDYFSFYGIKVFPKEIVINEHFLYEYDNDLKRFYLRKDKSQFFPIVLAENINNFKWESNNFCWYSIGKRIGKFTPIDVSRLGIFERYESFSIISACYKEDGGFVYEQLSEVLENNNTSLQELDIASNLKIYDSGIAFFKKKYNAIEINLNEVLNIRELLIPIFDKVGNICITIKDKKYSFKDLFFSYLFEYFSCEYLDGYILSFLLELQEISRGKEMYKQKKCSVVLHTMCGELFHFSLYKNVDFWNDKNHHFLFEDREDIFSDNVLLQKKDYDYLLLLKNEGNFILGNDFIDFWVKEIANLLMRLK